MHTAHARRHAQLDNTSAPPTSNLCSAELTSTVVCCCARQLENVLLDHAGHCKLSDLGLAVVTKVKIKGYAGTPGYTGPTQDSASCSLSNNSEWMCIASTDGAMGRSHPPLTRLSLSVYRLTSSQLPR